MDTRRTCRACGCWELRACEGGCSWISADRCSACPDAPLTLPINAAHVGASRWTLQMHLRLGRGRHSYVKQSFDFPNLVMSYQTENGVVKDRHLFVGVLEVPEASAAGAAELLNSRREAA